MSSSGRYGRRSLILLNNLVGIISAAGGIKGASVKESGGPNNRVEQTTHRFPWKNDKGSVVIDNNEFMTLYG